MKRKLVALPVHPIAKVASLTMGIWTLIFYLPIGLMGVLMGGEEGWSWGIFAAGIVLFPLLYMLMVYLASALGVFIFNSVAQRAGGIELEFANTADRDHRGHVG